MKKFIFLSLLLIMLGAASAKAQVAISERDQSSTPHAGAVLDLQSTAKGLLLPHVALDDLETLQVGGSGAGEDLTATGMIVYNIGPNFCEGVYVWNGNQWRKVDKDYQERASTLNNLVITVPDEDDAIVGGEEVTFKATPGNAKFYSWYLNGVFLETTKSPIFTTTAIPAGVGHKMKVVLDDCLSLSSDEITFDARYTSHASMPSTPIEGDEWIRIYSDASSPFPYAATGDYEPNGLVAHFDGINNIGEGDKAHDFSATAWKDLKNEFSISKTGSGQWLSNGFQALDAVRSFYSNTFPDTYPVGNSPRTLEVIFRTPDTNNMYVQANNVSRDLFSYGHLAYVNDQDHGGTRFSVTPYRGAISSLCKAGSDMLGWIMYAIGGHHANLQTCLSSVPSLTTANTINTVTSTYANSIKDTATTKSYINNSLAVILGRGASATLPDGSLRTTPGTSGGEIALGENLSHSTFLSVRLYNRVLSPEEIQHNAELDQKRYLAPPQVLIGNQQCANVTVLSPRVITCKVPVCTQSTNTLLNITVLPADADDSTQPILEYEDIFTYTQ